MEDAPPSLGCEEAPGWGEGALQLALWGGGFLGPQQILPHAELGAWLTRGRGMGFCGFLEPSFFMAL